MKMKMKMKKKLTLLLAFALVLSMIPAPAAAARLANVFSFIISPCYRGLFGSKAFRCLRTPQTGD